MWSVGTEALQLAPCKGPTRCHQASGHGGCQWWTHTAGKRASELACCAHNITCRRHATTDSNAHLRHLHGQQHQVAAEVIHGHAV